MYKKVDPLRICSGAKLFDQFMDALLLIFNSHGYLYPQGGPDRIKYIVTVLDSWRTHHNPTHRQTAMTDPSEWAGH